MISAGTYEFNLYFCITENYTRLKKEVIRIQKRKPDEDIEIEGKVRGCVFRKETFVPIIWIPRAPKTPREYATLQHEILHVVHEIMKWANMELNDHTEEAYCHLMGHLTNKIIEIINKKTKQ